MLIFGLHSTSDDRPGWSMDSNPIHHPSPAKKMRCSFLDYVQHLMISWAGQWTRPRLPPLSSQKMKCSFLDYIQLLMTGQAGRWTQTPSTTPLQPKNEMLIFGLCSTSDDWLGWSMDSNPIHHPSPAKKVKCSFLDYVQLLVISRAMQVNRNVTKSPQSHQKMKYSFLYCIQLLMMGQAGRWTQTPSTTPLQPKK